MAMALVNTAIEPSTATVAFTSGNLGGLGMYAGYGSGLVGVPLSAKQRLDDVIKMTDRIPFGGTDCAIPMIYAEKHNLKVDTFIIYTDSETWAGEIHPCQALDSYRQKSGRPAKLIVCGMVSNGFSIADPNDKGMLDVVGFDTATPKLISEFSGK
jgi:60 kDa SS-A/Ro ribonucleoprotein